MVLGGDEPTGSLVRPYAVTRGRTRPQLEIALEALVETTARGRSGQFLGGREQKVIVDLCGGRLQSLAEIAARMEVPLGVARVLVADMAADGLLAVHEPTGFDADGGDGSVGTELLERVLSGLRRL
ncbi:MULTISPECIES: DUF742 domain-containing protein [Glycomyces]|jgi:hypothetical protein|uniref:DUF742 domain-containing protein n=4 Tax=Glycomyces TaxID=58113 RepID=A0A9W6G7E9_9ACTN|nr:MULTISPECIES: DUF742 domain-containing protein [Glycomyces]HEX2145592.1 DUF742 domain-containing protein [Glycomyces sp.]MCC3762720.1 DUF742 domain-containing protein [Glycomyces sp. TRM65418]MDA1358441.1 DUF742 domain-containing protein [Glycomyces luteolus]MDA1366277.1 DUF742 domain-containing protein [Glycomyces algeriensis]MDN3240486.1 DUF742 domain-containing protein [Glycomyces tritici]